MPLQHDYEVRLDAFRGPLDLLLYLIRRAEVDITDIPIHEITEQYFEFLKHIDRIDIDVAGEFLVMAATLIEIKSRTLAPVERRAAADGGAGEAEALDPRHELVQQLLAYQKFRFAAETLEARKAEFSRRFPVRVGAADAEEEPTEASLELEDANPLDLFNAYDRIIAAIDLTRLGEHRVEYDDTPIALHQEDLIDRLDRAQEHRLTLQEVFEGRTHGEQVGLFLATLELARQRRVVVHQDDLFAPIRVELNADPDDGLMHFEDPQAAGTLFATEGTSPPEPADESA
jgi:segregation and condensation protein A